MPGSDQESRGNRTPDDVARLIEEAAAEQPERFESEFTGSAEPHLPALNQPVSVALAWIFAAFVVVELWLHPLVPEEHLSVPSLETELSIAMYHVAHRVEVYRDITGQLPEFLESSWSLLGQRWGASDLVEYTKEGNSYRIVGRTGKLEIVFEQGDDPERLIHYEERLNELSGEATAP